MAVVASMESITEEPMVQLNGNVNSHIRYISPHYW